MNLSLTSWSLPACTLIEAAGIARTLGFDAMDLGYLHGPALDRLAILTDPERAAEPVQALGLNVPSFYHLFGGSLFDRNLADPANRDANEADLRLVSRFCRAIGAATLFVLPGVCNPGQDRSQALSASAESLRRLLPIAAEAGVQLTVEPHVHSYLESPGDVLDLLHQVPGLKLTLDYAHFVCLGWRQSEIDALCPHAAHVHLRQARPGALQAKLDLGTINIEAELGSLREARFDGYLAIEAVHQDYMDTRYDGVLTETIRLRDRVKAWLG